MPTETKVGNPRNGKPGQNHSQKGKPLGIPKWGWVVGIALGLIIGYLVLKHSGSSASASDNGSGSGSSPLGNPDSGSGGGASSGSSPANPFVIAGNHTQGEGSQPSAVSGSGDSSTSTNTQTPIPYVQPGSTTTQQINTAGGGALTQTAPGSDYYVPVPAAGGQANKSGGVTGNPSNVHIPGLQE